MLIYPPPPHAMPEAVMTIFYARTSESLARASCHSPRSPLGAARDMSTCSGPAPLVPVPVAAHGIASAPESTASRVCSAAPNVDGSRTYTLCLVCTLAGLTSLLRAEHAHSPAHTRLWDAITAIFSIAAAKPTHSTMCISTRSLQDIMSHSISW